VCAGYTSEGLTRCCITRHYIHLVRKTSRGVIWRDSGGGAGSVAAVNRANCVNGGFETPPRVDFLSEHQWMQTHVHVSPAQADKSFLLPSTSSMLRAQESISEPGVEASPLKNTHRESQKKIKLSLLGGVHGKACVG